MGASNSFFWRGLRLFHPNVHFVVPAGGVSPDWKRWIQTRPDRLFHPLPADKVYKRLFVEAIRQVGLYHRLPRGVLKQDSVVHLKPVGDGQAVLKFLAPYIFLPGRHLRQPDRAGHRKDRPLSGHAERSRKREL